MPLRLVTKPGAFYLLSNNLEVGAKSCVTEKLRVSSTYTLCGSPKLPKEGNFAGNGNFSYENTKLIQLGGECITTYNLVFVKDRSWDRLLAILTSLNSAGQL